MNAPRPGDEPTEPSASEPPPPEGQGLYLGPTSHGSRDDFRSADPNALTQPGDGAPEGTPRCIPEVPGYELLGELGRGGMGVVYKAIQRRLQRVVALKMVLAGIHASHETTLRFLAESEAIARLTHPNVVQIFATGDLAGVPYFAMEYVGGGSLSARLDGTPWEPRDAARLIETLAHAVQEAHRLGIVHRDLKPGNILFTPLGVPKLVDFGLVKWLNLTSDLTQTESVMGSPSYMAPEQACGDKLRIGTAADLYSLGAILYELLTGRPPFKAASVLETLEQVKTLEPVRPGRLQPKLPGDLETIVLKCLEKDPARRYASAAALAADLRNWLDGRPITARPVGHIERCWRWCRRNRPLAAASATALLALTALAITSTVAAIALTGYAAAQKHEKGVANEALRIARMNLDQAERERRQAQRLAAAQALGRGLLMGERGDADRGLHWIVHALALGGATDNTGQLAARANLAAWQDRINPLVDAHALTVPFQELTFTPDASTLLAYGRGNEVNLLETATGAPVGPALRHPQEVLAAVLVPGGQTVLTGCRDGLVRLWDARRGTLLVQSMAHGGPVRALAISADGRLALSGGATDKTARLWHLPDGQPAADPWVHGTDVRTVALSPDGSLALSGATDGTVRLWKIPEKKPVGPAVATGSEVLDVLFSPDAATALVVSADGSARLLDPASGQPLGTPLRQGRDQRSSDPRGLAAFSADGRLALAGAWDGTARLWDADDGTPVGRALVHDGPIRAVALSADGRYALTGSMDKTARIWDTRDGTPVGPPLEHRGAVIAVAFAPDGKTALTASDEGALRVWKLAEEHLLGPPLSTKGSVFSVAIDRTGQWALTGSRDGTAQLWRTADGAPVGPPMQHQGAVWAVAFSPDGTLALTASHDGTARLWHIADSTPASPELRHGGRIWAAAFRPDGGAIVTAGDDGTARLWNVADGQVLGPPLRHDGPVRTVAFSPDSTFLVTGSADGAARQWRADDGALLRELVRGPETVFAVAVSPDAKRIATGDGHGIARIWNAADGAPDGPPLLHQGSLNSVTFSPDGKVLLVASSDRTARLWAVPSGEPIGPPLEHHGTVFAACFSPDGKLVATASHDKTARLWSATDGTPIGPSLRHRGWIWAVAFDPGGHRVLTGSGDGSARFWPVPEPMPGTVELLELWAQVVTGLALDQTGAVSVLDADTWRDRRQHLREPDPPTDTALTR